MPIIRINEFEAAPEKAAGRIPPEQLAAVRPLLAAPPKVRYYDTAP
jgi:hypothetical protein